MVDMDCELDAQNYLDAIARMSGKEADRLLKRGLNAAAQVVLRQARTNLREVTGRARSKRYNAIKGYNLIKNRQGIVTGVRSLEQGIRTKYHASDEADGPYAKVNIMKDFRLRFFEGGTKTRRTRKGYDRGHIEASHFFTKAKNESMAAAEDKLDSIVMSGLQAIWTGRVGS